MRAIDGMHTERLAIVLHGLHFRIGIGGKPIDRNHNRNAELRQVAQMASQVLQTIFERLDVFNAEVLLGDTAVHLECLDCGNEYDSVGPQIRLTTFDIEKFLGAEIGTKACLGDDVVGKFECGLRCHYGVTPMRNVRERTTVHERRVVFDGLNKIGLQRIPQQCRHRAVRV